MRSVALCYGYQRGESLNAYDSRCNCRRTAGQYRRARFRRDAEPGGARGLGEGQSRNQSEAASGLDRTADDRRREARHARRRGAYAQAAARRGVPAGEDRADKRGARRVRHARCRRSDDAGHLLHVRREAVRPGGMVVAAARRQACRSRRRQGDHGPRRSQPEGAGERLPVGAARLQGDWPQAAGEHRAGRGGRGGNRIAALRRDRIQPGSAGGDEEGRGRLHPRRGPGIDRCDVDRPWRQGRGRDPADLERRELGQGPGQGRPLEPPRHRRQPGLAAGQGAGHLGQGRRAHARRRRLVRECAAADRAAKGIDRGGRFQVERGGAQVAARHQAMDRQRGLPDRVVPPCAAADDQHPGPGERLHWAGREDGSSRDARRRSSTFGWCQQ